MLGTEEHGNGQARQASGQSQKVNTTAQEILRQGRYRLLCGHTVGVANQGLWHQESLPRGGDRRLGSKDEWELVRYMGW